MNPVILLLEESGLYTRELARKFLSSATDLQIGDFVGRLREAVAGAEELIKMGSSDPLSFYNFMASSSLRGDNCKGIACRISKAKLVERYSALYCDQIVFPLWFESHHPDDAPDREILGGALFSLFELRPVIEHGYVCIARSEVDVCETCCEKYVPRYHEIMELSRQSSSKLIEQFIFTCTDLGSNGIRFMIEGPPEFLEHGGKHTVLNPRPDWAVGLKGKQRLSADFIRQNDLLRHVFLKPALDVALHQEHHEKTKTKYLTNLVGEAFLASGVVNNKSEPLKYAAAAELSHRIPLLQELDVNILLRLRKDEHDSFLLYRNALENAAKERFSSSSEMTQARIKEIYDDLFLPEVIKLRAMLNSKRRFGKSKAFLKSAAAASVVVALGAFTGPLSQKILEWGGTVTGVNLGRDLLDSTLDPFQAPSEIRTHPMYFLLRASQELKD